MNHRIPPVCAYNSWYCLLRYTDGIGKWSLLSRINQCQRAGTLRAVEGPVPPWPGGPRAGTEQCC
eukprot:2731013-Rhodomonas_salina.2